MREKWSECVRRARQREGDCHKINLAHPFLVEGVMLNHYSLLAGNHEGKKHQFFSFSLHSDGGLAGGKWGEK